MTLLEALWRAGGDAERVVDAIARGEIRLTGNFRGCEIEVCRDCGLPEKDAPPPSADRP